MKKFIKRLNEFLPQSMQMNSPTTKPTTVPTKPGQRPGPIPTTRPSTTPKPQATAMDVYNHFIDTLREVSGEFEFERSVADCKSSKGGHRPAYPGSRLQITNSPTKYCGFVGSLV